MTTTTKSKTVSRAKPKAPPQVIAEVHLIPVERIKVEAQVRTEFNEASIRELADDIEARGLRQPVEVTPIGDELYKLTIGERRLRAIQLLGQKAVPAIIVKTSDADRLVDQLAENIQREDLNLKDLAAAVRGIFDKIGSLDATAGRVKKSKPWVCKHLALSCPEFGWRARNLLEQGRCEDLELLNTLNQIEKSLEYVQVAEAYTKIAAGQMNRQQAREFLKTGKEAKAKRLEAEREAVAQEANTKANTPKPPKVKEFLPALELNNIEREIMKEGTTAEQIKAHYRPQEWTLIEELLIDCHEAGMKAKATENAVVALAKAIEEHNGYVTKLVAILRGFMDCERDLLRVVEDAKEAGL